MTDFDDSNAAYDEFEQEIIETSTIEVERLVSFLRAVHYLSTFNQGNTLGMSASGGIQVSDSMLDYMGYGFSDKKNSVFFLELQHQEYEIFTGLPIHGMWLEKDGFCVLFGSFKFGNYKMPPIRLSFRVYSKYIFQKIKECKYFSIAEIAPSIKRDGMYTVTKVHNPAIEILSSPPKGRQETKAAFSKAFM